MTGVFQRAAALLSLAWLSVLPVRGETFESIKQAVRKKFPSVRQISTDELARWLSDTNRVPPVLVDVREPQEFGVSHLHGARNLRSVAQIERLLPSSGECVVLYCSVGYRSSAMAEKLERAGVASSMNLEGSIFQWANEGRPLYRETNVVQEVHGFSRKWSKLLKPDVPVKF